MKRFLLAALLVIGGCATTGSPQSAESLNATAKNLLEQENYSAAVPALRAAAEAGHPEAQYNLGWALIEGAGTEADPVEANKWLRRAAEQGNADAQFKLAYSYVVGRGTEKDEREGFRWIERAAENGDHESQFTLIGMLLEGQGTDADNDLAIAWATRLGTREYPASLRVRQWVLSARLELVRFFSQASYGITPDPLQAYMWALIANENKVDLSIARQQQLIADVQALEDQLDPEDLSRGRREAEDTLGRPLQNLEKLHSREF